MEIFEFGHSVLKKYLGDQVTKHTFCCVVEHPFEKTLQAAFEEMWHNLAREKNNLTVDEKTLTVIDPEGNEYTLAHDIVIEKNKIVRVPNNVLRHVYSRQLTIHTLYIDENKEFIDLTQRAINDINACNIRLSSSYIERVLYAYPDPVLEIIKLHGQGYQMLDSIKRFIRNFWPEVPIADYGPYTEYFNKEYRKAMNFLDNYACDFKRYLEKICGMKFEISFGNPVQKEEQEGRFQFNVENPWRNPDEVILGDVRPGRRGAALGVDPINIIPIDVDEIGNIQQEQAQFDENE